jgi:tRNA/tmRNA/rRNA uracil-C5-methylase (TrmA/RlmC/RlmD family)
MLKTVRAGEYDVALVDPPRAGLSQDCLQELARLYRVSRLQPFDMFPQTAHVETLIELADGQEEGKGP